MPFFIFLKKSIKILIRFSAFMPFTKEKYQYAQWSNKLGSFKVRLGACNHRDLASFITHFSASPFIILLYNRKNGICNYSVSKASFFSPFSFSLTEQLIVYLNLSSSRVCMRHPAGSACMSAPSPSLESYTQHRAKLGYVRDLSEKQSPNTAE